MRSVVRAVHRRAVADFCQRMRGSAGRFLLGQKLHPALYFQKIHSFQNATMGCILQLF
jgi:hypothetical protein